MAKVRQAQELIDSEVDPCEYSSDIGYSVQQIVSSLSCSRATVEPYVKFLVARSLLWLPIH